MRFSRCVYCTKNCCISQVVSASQNTHQELVEKLYRYGGQLDFMMNHVTHHSLDFIIFHISSWTRRLLATLMSCSFVQKKNPTSSGSFSISAKICYKDRKGEYQDYEIRNALHNERWTSDIDGPWWTKVSIIPIFWSTRINFTSSCRWWSWVKNDVKNVPSGKHTKNYGKSQFLMGKSTINGHFQ